MISPRLGDDNYTNHGDSVHFHVTFDVRRTQFGATNITETNNLILILSDNEVVELFCRMHQTQRTDRQFYGVSFDTT